MNPLLVEENFLRHPHDYFQNNHLKTSLKEDEDYAILPHAAWEYLFDIYGGTDIPRLSIAVAKDDEDA